VSSGFQAKNTSHAVTPRFSLGWDVTADNDIYVNIAKGFREGNANRPIPLTPCVVSTCPGSLQSLGLTSVPSTYSPDSLWNYEVGDKARLFDRRLSIDWRSSTWIGASCSNRSHCRAVTVSSPIPGLPGS